MTRAIPPVPAERDCTGAGPEPHRRGVRALLRAERGARPQRHEGGRLCVMTVPGRGGGAGRQKGAAGQAFLVHLFYSVSDPLMLVVSARWCVLTFNWDAVLTVGGKV